MRSVTKVWMKSKLDKANDHAVNFEPAPFPIVTSLDGLVALIETAEVADLLDFSYGKALGIATDNIPAQDRRAALFLVEVATAVLRSSFDDKQRPWKANSQIGPLVSPYGGTLALAPEYRPILERYKTCGHPTLRFRLDLISFDEGDQANRPAAVARLFKSAIEAARHLFRYAEGTPQLLGLATLEVAANLASRYTGLVPTIDDILCTVRFVLYQHNSRSMTKCGLASLLHHFLCQKRRKEAVAADKSLQAVVAGLREEWVLAALNRNVWTVEAVRDRLIDLYIAIDRKDFASDIWDKSKDILEGFAEQHPGGISDGIIERLLSDGKSRLTTAERKDLIKLKRLSAQAMVASMKPVFGYAGSARAAREYAARVLAQTSIEARLGELFRFDYVPDDAAVEEVLAEEAGAFPLKSRIGVKKIVGDRDDGGTDSDPDFRTKETRMQYATYFLGETAYPVLSSIAANDIELRNFIEGSDGWDDAFATQFDRSLAGFKSGDSIQCIMYGISYLEGFLRRALDNNGVSVDKEKEAGAVIHGSMFESLFAELESFGFESREIDVFKLYLTEGTAGWNIRNLAYHGMAEDRSLDVVKATAVMFMLLKFAAAFRAGKQQRE